MDPISALSVAAAALQFVDFSRQIVCKSRELYQSSTGTIRENREAETVTMRLKELAQHLRQPANATSSPGSRLQGICEECVDTSDVLIGRLHALKIPQHGSGQGWKSFRQALKSAWSKREIDATAAKLSGLRAELDTEILVHLR